MILAMIEVALNRKVSYKSLTRCWFNLLTASSNVSFFSFWCLPSHSIFRVHISWDGFFLEGLMIALGSLFISSYFYQPLWEFYSSSNNSVSGQSQCDTFLSLYFCDLLAIRNNLGLLGADWNYGNLGLLGTHCNPPQCLPPLPSF